MFKKIRRIIKLNLQILRTKELTIKTKLKILWQEFVGIVNLLLGNKALFYLDEVVIYDNPSTVLTLLIYPHEISHKILPNIDGSFKKVLDIGGNIGQFSITMSKLDPKTEVVDVFEPNKDIFNLLKINTQNIENINIYNLGIGKTGKSKMYFAKNKSARGSLIKKNAIVDGSKLVETDIELTSDVPQITGTKHYDLVKVDVEGYELEVLQSLKNVKTKYLIIEIAGNLRKKNYIASQIYREIIDNWGDFEIINQTATDNKSEAFDVLMEFRPSKE